MNTVIRVIVALLLVLVGLSHQPPLGVGHAQAGLTATYTLPDGTVPDLCLAGDHGDDAGDPQHHTAVRTCEACLIAAAILLPKPADLAGRPMVALRVIGVPERGDAADRRLLRPNAAPRAPPLLALA